MSILRLRPSRNLTPIDRRFAVAARARIDLSSGPFMLGDNPTDLKHQVSEADHIHGFVS